MNKPSLRKRISYWFDNRMARGSMGLIRLLAILTLVIILVITCLIFFGGLGEEEGFLSAFWDSLSTIINAWMPSYEDGSIRYLVVMSLAALAGLFITSVLIGIISSAIEEKITSLKRGHSDVIEEGHTVVLGFYPGEYTLLRQLILAADGRPDCVVLVSEMEQEEMQCLIADNLEVPKNFRIICRTADIFDPAALARCALTTSRSVIVSPTDDFRTTKALLAVSVLLNSAGENKVRVGAIISQGKHQFPPSISARHNITTMQTNETIAKIIAHSCMEPGLSDTFRELFNYEGAELYVRDMPDARGLSFEEISLRMDQGVPVGIKHEGQIVLNPPMNHIFSENEELVVFSEGSEYSTLVEMPALPEMAPLTRRVLTERNGRVTIIGGCDSLAMVLKELPENVSEVTIAGSGKEYQEEALDVARERENSFTISFSELNYKRMRGLQALAEKAEHIVVLSNYEKSDDEADMDSVFLLMNLRDIRERLGLNFNITAEMRREYNQHLLVTDDNTDFVVSSNMSSLFLAQLAESPELIGAFRELLSNEGNEFYLKSAEELLCVGTYSVAALRLRILQQGYVFLGYLPAGSHHSFFNPPLLEELELKTGDQLIVIGED